MNEFQHSYAPDEAKLSASGDRLHRAGGGPRIGRQAPERGSSETTIRRRRAYAARPPAPSPSPRRHWPSPTLRRVSQLADGAVKTAPRSDPGRCRHFSRHRRRSRVRPDPRRSRSSTSSSRKAAPNASPAVVWSGTPRFGRRCDVVEAVSEPSWSRAYSPREHLSRAESLMKLGYRPVAWSATLPSADKTAGDGLDLAPAGGH